MDLGFQLRRAMETGKVAVGFRQTEKLLLNGRAKLVILSSGAKDEIKDRVKYLCKIGGIPIYIFDGKNIDLGHLCNKPFGISVIAIEDEGDSSILEIARGEKT